MIRLYHTFSIQSLDSMHPIFHPFIMPK